MRRQRLDECAPRTYDPAGSIALPTFTDKFGNNPKLYESHFL
jgi:hypothetical protein